MALTAAGKKNKKVLPEDWHFKLWSQAGSLCNGDYERDLKFEIFDWEFTGAHKSMGVFHTTLRDQFILHIHNYIIHNYSDRNPRKVF